MNPFTLKILMIFTLFVMNYSICAESLQMDIKISAYENKIGQLDVLILKAELFNLHNEVTALNDPQNSWFQYRKAGAKDWILTSSLTAVSGSYKTSEPNIINIQSQSVYNFHIGVAFYTNKSNNENGNLEWIYPESGKYEIRLIYKISSEEEEIIIHSNIVEYEIVEYQGINAKAFNSLSQLPVPSFFNDAYLFGSNLALAENRMNVIEVCYQVINNFPESKFYKWAKLYLLEMEIYKNINSFDNLILKEKVLEFKNISNPFMRERIEFLLEYIDKK